MVVKLTYDVETFVPATLIILLHMIVILPVAIIGIDATTVLFILLIQYFYSCQTLTPNQNVQNSILLLGSWRSTWDWMCSFKPRILMCIILFAVYLHFGTSNFDNNLSELGGILLNTWFLKVFAQFYT